MALLVAISFLCSLTCSLLDEGAREYASPFIHQFGLLEENDVFGASRSDRHYTQGLRFELFWQRAEARRRSHGEAFPNGMVNLDLGEPWFIPRWFYAWDAKRSFSNGIAIGHNIYTPSDITATVLDPEDRPYAAWLYAGFITRVTDGDEEWQDSWELDLGVVGTAALGEEVQSEFHELIHSKNPQWVDPLPNDPGVMLTWSRRWIAGGPAVLDEPPPPDWRLFAIPQVTLRAGLPLSTFGVGASILGGWNVPRDFDAGRINPSFLPRRTEREEEVSLYAFAGTEGRLVAYNTFLDGTVTEESHEVEKNDFVADFYAGITVRFWKFSFSHTQVVRSPEFETADKYHSFGTLHITLVIDF